MTKKFSQWKQGFFDEVEPILLREPLAFVLGSQKKDEPFVFNYTDAVMLAGHSCPSVSGVYKLTQKALKALYGNELPVRGEIKVLIKGGPSDLAYGPQAQVISFITGASGATGFKGLGGRFGRDHRLFFDPKDVQFNVFIFQREDTGKTVKAHYNPQALPPAPGMGDLISLVLQGIATEAEHEEFISLWQGNVKNILLHEDKFPGLIEIQELKDYKFPETRETAF